MSWTNGPLRLYHGCDNRAAANITGNGVDWARGRVRADFGQGFYTTTFLHQAKNWARLRCMRVNASVPRGSGAPPVVPVVLSFDVDRNTLAALEALCFVTEGSSTDYWDLVTHCRSGQANRTPSQYPVVYGPVSVWPQYLVLKDCDQISFHSDAAVRLLPTPAEVWRGP